mmetsp:Transcript_48223/g.149126  ORF Transcript_48223/g.149126 Transcript_48223/m.149126 type:complete len:469 (+) Transcript_48223:86-1492(+)
MWARRCGAPHYWPSRVRVFFSSFTTAALGFTIFQYLTAADVGYLDLSAPLQEDVMCLTDWPLRHESKSWLTANAYTEWMQGTLNRETYPAEHACPVSLPSEQALCTEVRIPVTGLQRKVGLPLGENANINSDVLATYAFIFLYLGLCVWFTVTVHDLALLSLREHDYILDLKGVRVHFPRLCFALNFLSGVECWKKLLRGTLALRLLAWALVPFLVIWAILIFCFVWWPIAVLVYLRHPIRLARLAVFSNFNLFGIYGVALTVQSLVWLGNDNFRPQYGVTWEASGADCICGCVFHIAQIGCLQVLVIGVTVAFKSFYMAFRCLKGLRRTNWASLLTVMFTIPLAVYPVTWTQPDGSAIQHRKDGEPVQGELAFDPFALMDEQPESADMTVQLKPIPRQHSEGKLTVLTGPANPSRSVMFAEGEEYIGCCGFPHGSQPHQRRSSPEPPAASGDGGPEAAPEEGQPNPA